MRQSTARHATAPPAALARSLTLLQASAPSARLRLFREQEGCMAYVPHTDAERSKMLKAIGVADMAGLFPDVPARVRFPKLDLPPPSSELDIAREMRTLGSRNVVVDPSLSFLGAG